MHFLLTNDDGYHAEGIQVLARALAKIGDVTIAAPDRDQSGVSQALTLRYPIRVKTLHDQQHLIEGTPTDCVHVALSNFMEHAPDWVISGINHGPNLGDDVLYSGTVAAAVEGYMAGCHAMAVSLDGKAHHASAAQMVVDLIKRWKERPTPGQCLWNLNVPDVPHDAIKGVKVTGLGQRIQKPKSFAAKDPRGNEAYWLEKPISPPIESLHAGDDFLALSQQYASLTPLRFDLTDHERQSMLEEWLV